MTGRIRFRSQWPAVVVIVGMLVIGLGLPLVAGASPSRQTSGATGTVVTTGTPIGTTTSTPVGTGTVSPGIPTSASPILVSRFTANRVGKTVLFRWTMVLQDGIKGFKLYAGHHALVHRALRTHQGLSYHYRVRWSGHGPYSLLLLPEYGKAVRVHATR